MRSKIAILLAIIIALGSSESIISYALNENKEDNIGFSEESDKVEAEENISLDEESNKSETEGGINFGEESEKTENLINENDSKDELNTIENTKLDDKFGKTYKKIKNAFKKSILQDDDYIPKEALDDLNALKNIDYLEKMTDYKYEIALAYENGDYTYLESADTIEEAMQIVRNKSEEKHISDMAIPVVIDENGLVIYTEKGIGRIVKIIDGIVIGTNDTTHTTSIYKTENSKSAYASINHAYIDDVPIIEDNGKRVKIQVNGFVGWIDKEDSTGINIIYVPMNQAINISYYTKNLSGGLSHYISSDIQDENNGHIRTIGVAPSYMQVNKKYYSYDAKYFYTSIDSLILDLKSNSNDNSINQNNPYYNYYTYLPARSKTIYTAKEIENYIINNTAKDSMLRGQAINIVKSQNKYGVNASFILGIAMNESWKGISSLAKAKNNLFGIDAIDFHPDKAKTFDSVSDCIEEFAKNYMSNQSLNPKSWKYAGGNLGNKQMGVNLWYATDPFWGEKAAEFMYDMDVYLSRSNNSLLDFNRYQLAVYGLINEVKNSNGEVLYKVLKTRDKQAQIGDSAIIISQKSDKYEVYPDRQVRMDQDNPNPGVYDWSILGYIDTNGIKMINNKNQNSMSQTNSKPTIDIKPISLQIGDKFDPKQIATANDKEDGDLSEYIEIVENKVDTSKAGVYKVVYKVVDTDNNICTKEINITVKSVTDKNADYYDHWGKESIEYAMANEWVLSSNQFRPDDSITRSEFVKVVNRAFNKTAEEYEPFIDVNPSDWFYSEVRKGVAAGYLSTGYNKFRPFDNITRQEASKIIGSIMNIKGDGKVTFKDANQISDWALEYVDGLNEKGIIKGSNGYFAPHDNLTRAEAVTILHRANK